MIAYRAPLVPFAAAAVLLSGCIAAGHTSSPWEWGGGPRIAPGFAVGAQEGVTLHPVAGYTYLSFDGGHDGLWEAGLQLRKSSSALSDRWPGFWLGVEGTYSHLRTVMDIDGSSSTYTTNGYSFTGLAGAPISGGRWGPNWFAGAGLSHYGDMGFNVRLGIDLQPWFLAR